MGDRRIYVGHSGREKRLSDCSPGFRLEVSAAEPRFDNHLDDLPGWALDVKGPLPLIDAVDRIVFAQSPARTLGPDSSDVPDALVWTEALGPIYTIDPSAHVISRGMCRLLARELGSHEVLARWALGRRQDVSDCRAGGVA